MDVLLLVLLAVVAIVVVSNIICASLGHTRHEGDPRIGVWERKIGDGQASAENVSYRVGPTLDNPSPKDGSGRANFT